MTWTKLSIAMLCCWSMSAWAADPWCNARDSPAYQFEWLPKNRTEESIGSVLIKDASGKIVQVLDNVENYHHVSESLNTGSDFNNDGCADLVVTSSIAPTGNESRMAFLYNPTTRRFELSKTLSDLVGLELDTRDKNCVTSFAKGGAMDFYAAQHCWSKDKLGMKSEETVWPTYNDEGELECYYHTKISYRGGKKRVRTKCTKQWPP